MLPGFIFALIFSLDNIYQWYIIKAMTKEELKTWRKDKGLSQAKMAHLLGVRVMTISRWELGTRSIPTLLSLALKGLERELESQHDYIRRADRG